MFAGPTKLLPVFLLGTEHVGRGIQINLFKFKILEGTGAYGPLVLAPAEGLGGTSGSLTYGGNLI